MSDGKRSKLAAWAETVAHICTPVAILIAAWQFAGERDQQADERRFAIYNQINDQYVQFLDLCVRHEWVDCFDLSCADLMDRYPKAPAQGSGNAQERRPGDLDPMPRNAREARIEAAAFGALLSLLERAYVFYQETLPAGDPMVDKQWNGWLVYARSMAKRERFRAQWKDLGCEFDSGFAGWMNGLLKEPSK